MGTVTTLEPLETRSEQEPLAQLLLLFQFSIPAAGLLHYSSLMATSRPTAYRPGQLWFSIPLTARFSGPGSCS